ncbi:ribosomal protein L7/L12 [Sorangium sp. So ce887]|uniref:ribosomal protein L7/L12 n=1 Tax=Sorangium sp. So ce887 TaxID=3133324 RepID=UPI003F5FFF10
MRIRLFNAFASNNSGSYTIVGSFRDAATAEEVARLVQEVCDAHSAWLGARDAAPAAAAPEGDSPLEAFAQREGLRADNHGGDGDDWPQYGPSPAAIAAGHQVIVHAPYTVTMPPVFGALFYAKGGRVETELDHAHEELAVEFSYWPADVRWDDPGAAERLDAFEQRVTAELPAWTAPREHDSRPPIAPAWHGDGWRSRHLSAVFADLVEGVQGVRRLAREHGMRLTVRVTECPHGVADPFARLRARPNPWGPFHVILWQIGPDRIAAMKAVRQAVGCDLDEVKAALEGLPREILVDVTEEHARRAADLLRQAGCDAEAVVPARR